MTEKNAISGMWGMLTVRGIVLLVLGIMMFMLGRGVTMLALIQVMGAYWIVGGCFDLFEGVVGRSERSRIWAIIGALFSMVAGVFVIGHPIISGLIASIYLIYFMGIAAVVAGVAQIIVGQGKKRSLGGLVMGIFSVIFGMIVIFNPLMTQAVILLVLPFWAVITGVAALLSAFRMRQVEQANRD